MSAFHRLRRLGHHMGLDVQRAGETFMGRLVGHLARREVRLVLDVGANSGQYGDALRRHGYDADIVSFEPVPEVFERLASTTAAEPRWRPMKLALGDADREIEINVADNHGASSSVLPMLGRHVDAAPESRYVSRVKVMMKKLDSIWRDVVSAEDRPFLKLDVQGYEAVVLDGAAESLGLLEGIQVELSLVPLYEGAATPEQMFERMAGEGMRLVDLSPGFVDPTEHELLQVDAVFMRDR